MKNFRLVLMMAALGAAVPVLGGCSFLAGAAVGAAGTEVAREEGYELDSPIEKTEKD